MQDGWADQVTGLHHLHIRAICSNFPQLPFARPINQLGVPKRSQVAASWKGKMFKPTNFDIEAAWNCFGVYVKDLYDPYWG